MFVDWAGVGYYPDRADHTNSAEQPRSRDASCWRAVV